VEERRKEREEKQAVSSQLTVTKKLYERDK